MILARWRYARANDNLAFGVLAHSQFNNIIEPLHNLSSFYLIYALSARGRAKKHLLARCFTSAENSNVLFDLFYGVSYLATRGLDGDGVAYLFVQKGLADW